MRGQLRRNKQIADLTLHFCKGLNVLIGENNSCKTAVIDALRICLCYGNQKRDIYVSYSDFHIDKTAINDDLNDIEFHLHFNIEAPEEAGWFNDLLSVQEDGTQDLQLHFRYYLDEDTENQTNRRPLWRDHRVGRFGR